MRYELVVEGEEAQLAFEGFLAQHPEVRAIPLERMPWETDAFIENLVEIAEHAESHPETLVTLAEAKDFARKQALNHGGKAI